MPLLSHPLRISCLITCLGQPLGRRIVLLVTFALSGCSGYDFKVNDRVVYSPAPPFENYAVEDDSLRTCIDQHIKDGNVTAAGQLTRLNCSHAGIRSLQGLPTFGALAQVRLSHNQIVDVTPLGQLSSLIELQLDHNPIQNAAPLAGLVNLQVLDLSGNAALDCATTGPLAAVPQYRSPTHCGP